MIFRAVLRRCRMVSIMVPAFVEPTPRLELGTSFLPRMCSTTELCGLGAFRSEFRPRSCLVQGVGFEPTKHKAADLQSAGFDRSPIPAQPSILTQWAFQLIRVTIFVTLRKLRIAGCAYPQWSPRGDSNPPTCQLQIGCAAIAPLGLLSGKGQK